MVFDREPPYRIALPWKWSLSGKDAVDSLNPAKIVKPAGEVTSMVLMVRTTKTPAVTITRQAIDTDKLVYIAVANKRIKYPKGKSKIVYIGTTKNGADRIAASAAKKAKSMLGIHGVTHLEIFVITSSTTDRVKTWLILERGLLISFRERFGAQPKCNIVGKKMKWSNETEYFRRERLDGVIEKYSKIGISLPTEVECIQLATLRQPSFIQEQPRRRAKEIE